MSLQTISSMLAKKPLKVAYSTDSGAMISGDSEKILAELPDDSIDLIFTSPPFALQRKKEYGNKEQDEYVDWLLRFGKAAFPKLKDTGSFVIDLGGAYEKGVPVRSLYNYKVLIRFCDDLGYRLAEEFFWFNPSKLPSPIEWVNKRKIRAKDSVNTVWWFSKTPWPKANVKNVLAPYSERMKKLIVNPAAYYSPKDRPSGHAIGSGFGKDNGGAIPSNLLSIPNSESNSSYLKNCALLGISGHPARFPEKLPEFFIKFLTDEGDVVLDIFAGSNTTGSVSEKLNRQWLSIEEKQEYVANSVLRFFDSQNDKQLRLTYENILTGAVEVHIDNDLQTKLFA
jgi:DNA modification methylase